MVSADQFLDLKSLTAQTVYINRYDLELAKNAMTSLIIGM